MSDPKKIAAVRTGLQAKGISDSDVDAHDDAPNQVAVVDKTTPRKAVMNISVIEQVLEAVSNHEELWMEFDRRRGSDVEIHESDD